MADSKYGKYIISNPIVVDTGYSHAEGIKGITFPNEIFMNSSLVKGCPILIDIGWYFAIPDPDPVDRQHSHNFDMALCFVGSDPKHPSRLGAELEVQLGDEKHMLSKTSAIFIPKGLLHCPIIHRSVDRPYLQIKFAIRSEEKNNVSGQEGNRQVNPTKI